MEGRGMRGNEKEKKGLRAICVGCGKEFAWSTLKKHDGQRCSRCFDRHNQYTQGGHYRSEIPSVKLAEGLSYQYRVRQDLDLRLNVDFEDTDKTTEEEEGEKEKEKEKEKEEEEKETTKKINKTRTEKTKTKNYKYRSDVFDDRDEDF
jgi:hypothetical protein